MTYFPLITLICITVILIIAGLIEYRSHKTVLNTIPLRIHVNGTRGKSSITRLIAAGLRAGGMHTFAKTTGTAPRIIDTDGKDRIIHRLRSASIGEQVRLLRYFAKQTPDAVVMECMAVQPQYQWISEHQMIKSHIGVISNVRPDHVEQMGSTETDIAKSLANTIPVNGTLITAEEKMLPVLSEIAGLRSTVCVFADESDITESELNAFTYLEHPQNVKIALEVCHSAGVDRKTALEGMHKVKPDLGALAVWKLDFYGKLISVINGMAANDPVSTLQIWNFAMNRYPVEGDTCIFINTREDRQIRTRQMLQLTLEKIKPDRVIIRGERVESQVKHLTHYSPGTRVEIVKPDEEIDKIIARFQSLPSDSLIFTIGNQVGKGQEILDQLIRYRYHG